MMISKEILNKLKKISKEYELDAFILFGSRARNTAKKTSDYDLAYFKKNELNSKLQISLENALFEVFKEKKFDLVIIDEQTPIILKMQILRDGVPIYINNLKTFEKLKEGTYFDYVDSFSLLEPTKEKFLSQPL